MMISRMGLDIFLFGIILRPFYLAQAFAGFENNTLHNPNRYKSCDCFLKAE